MSATAAGPSPVAVAGCDLICAGAWCLAFVDADVNCKGAEQRANNEIRGQE